MISDAFKVFYSLSMQVAFLPHFHVHLTKQIVYILINTAVYACCIMNHVLLKLVTATRSVILSFKSIFFRFTCVTKLSVSWTLSAAKIWVIYTAVLSLDTFSIDWSFCTVNVLLSLHGL